MRTKIHSLLSAMLCAGLAAGLAACITDGKPTDAQASADGPSVSRGAKPGAARPYMPVRPGILKEGEPEQAPQMATSEGEFVLRDGAWSRVPGPAPLAKSAIERYGHGYITDIKVVAGSTSGTACPSGYYKLDGDLNRRAGGKWIYFCYKTGAAAQALDTRQVSIYLQDSYGTGPGEMKGIGGVSNGDMNQGATGKFVFGTYSLSGLGGDCKMAGIGIVTDPAYAYPFITRPGGMWAIIDQTDINAGAGGDFIYLTAKYESWTAYNNCPNL